MVRRKHPIDPNVVEKSTIEKATALNNLSSLMGDIFDDAQRQDANLRADAIRLRDLQLACSLNAPRKVGEPEDIDFEGEARFLKLVNKMVNLVIKTKKREPTADRVQRFIAGFLQYIQSRDEEAKQRAREKVTEDVEMKEAGQPTNEEEEEEGEYETVTSRFVESFLRHLFKGFLGSKAIVRTRCCQIIALSISSMGELDEDLYQDLKSHLFESHLDKDAGVRAQAVTALCRLQSDDEVNPSDGQTILDKLMWSVRHDPSAEVRRLILFNIDVSKETVPYLVKSIRDPDDTNRRVVYLKPLSDLRNFRMLQFDERLQVLQWGLNDRTELVRKAALKMFSERWIAHASNNLIEFLERLEATRPAVAPLVEKLLKAFFKDRMDIVNEISFDDEFWNNLSGESALLAKALIEFLQSQDGLDERLDDILPEVTRHVFNLENYYNLYRAHMNAEDASLTNYEFILTQLLDISLCLDYADEVGRRKMFEFLRHVLKSEELLDDHLERVIKVFRMISIDERDFTRSIIEIISDIQEEAEEEEVEDEEEGATKRTKLTETTMAIRDSTPSKETDESTQDTKKSTHETFDNLVIQFRCLNICKRMLENSYEPLTDNSSLYGLLNDLIVPAVQNADTLLRQEGLHCLGLCCTLDKRLAQHNITLFITCIKHGHEDLVKKAVRTLGDVLLMYGVDTMADYLSGPNDIREVFEFGLDHDNTEIQSLTTQALCKLMLFNRFDDSELLRLMVLLYFFPQTEIDEASNIIHQCLAYFFPAYCYSSAAHQKAISNITIPALEELCHVYSDLAEDETMTHPKNIADMLADWNDPEKLSTARSKQPGFIASDQESVFQVPGTLAVQALKVILGESEDLRRKTLCHFVLRLRLEKISFRQMKEICDLIRKMDKKRPIKVMPTRKAFERMANRFDSILTEEGQQDIQTNLEEEDEEEEDNNIEESSSQHKHLRHRKRGREADEISEEESEEEEDYEKKDRNDDEDEDEDDEEQEDEEGEDEDEDEDGEEDEDEEQEDGEEEDDEEGEEQEDEEESDYEE
ncbi:nuclear condensing complex subunit [Blakeslea trispora]|nr:nuclear condensing complex subunit [Blakeslea trispora]